jgi:hypothetical protein
MAAGGGKLAVLIGLAITGAALPLYYRHSVAAAAPAYAPADPAKLPAAPPNPADLYRLRQRVCRNTSDSDRSTHS